jgi:hypothetical protein
MCVSARVVLRPNRECSSARCDVTAVWPHRLATTMGQARRLQTCVALPGTACSSGLSKRPPKIGLAFIPRLQRPGSTETREPDICLVTKCAIYEPRLCQSDHGLPVLVVRSWTPIRLCRFLSMACHDRVIRHLPLHIVVCSTRCKSKAAMPRMDLTALEFLSATTIVPDLEESPITPGSSYAPASNRLPDR